MFHSVDLGDAVNLLIVSVIALPVAAMYYLTKDDIRMFFLCIALMLICVAVFAFA